MTTSFSYVISMKGLVNDTFYPYKAVYAKCPKTLNGVRAGNILSYTQIANNLNAYKTALASSQLSIAIFVDNNWYYYSSGTL